jgi:hypothetical protein
MQAKQDNFHFKPYFYAPTLIPLENVQQTLNFLFPR